jgi:hypothetical protein
MGEHGYNRFSLRERIPHSCVVNAIQLDFFPGRSFVVVRFVALMAKVLA